MDSPGLDLRNTLLTKAYIFVTELHAAFLQNRETSDQRLGLTAKSKGAQDALWELIGVLASSGGTHNVFSAKQ